MQPKIAIVIPTRNRPNQIGKLLESLIGQDVDQIIVSFSGQQLLNVIEKFSDLLPIKFIESSPGQINQKINAISSLDKNIDWVVFSDDDVVYPWDFFKILKSVVREQNIKDVIGIGFKINSYSKKVKFISRIFNSLFRIQSGSPGSVRPNGECIHYSNGNISLETQWLNGASAWRISEALAYSSAVPSTKYAAYEDAIFSHSRSACGKLMFIPTLQINYSDAESLNRITCSSFKPVFYWKLMFVINYQLSIHKYIWTSIGISFAYLVSKNKNEKLFDKLKIVLSTWKVIFSTILQNDKYGYLVKKIKSEISF
jgi:glycosyltransferase involved in cell wall biosynthesis